MNPTKIEHIGIAVENLNNAIKFYQETFGLHCYKIEEVENQQVRTAFFQAGNCKIELLESTHPEGPIAKFLKKHGEGIHHIAFYVNNIMEAMNEAQLKDIRLLNTKPAKGADNLDIVFLHPNDTKGVLIELCSRSM